ncbi:MAG: cytochrome c [Planctomycetes bacterium]|nr:cytochrome c [Planctomycetota bacterium]
MRLATRCSWVPAVMVVFGVLAVGSVALADPPPAPKISSFAPAADLSTQLAEYLTELEEAVASEQEFEDSQETLVKDASTVVVIALALGLHDEDNKYKAAAPGLLKAAQALAVAKDYAAAKAGVAAVKAAAAGSAGGELKWEKVASLEALMEQVPRISSKLKRYIRGSRFESKADDTAGFSAVIAAIGQGALADSHEAKDDAQVQQWYGFSAEMRDAAGAVNAAIRAQDEDAATAAMERLGESCDSCHAVFHIEE